MPRTEWFCPDWASAPGDTIGDILRERNLSINDFAQRIGRTTEEATDLLLGRSAITIGLARRLEEALGGSVEFWMSRDFLYHQQIAQRGPADDAWLQQLPISDMVSFGWLKPAPKPREELAACLKFFGVPNVAVWHRVYRTLEQNFSFRTSPALEAHPAAVAAWLRRGELEAEKIKCAPWTARGFQKSLSSIRSLTRQKDPKRFPPLLKRICAEEGVAVAIVRSPTGCRASGATRFIAQDKALLLLSVRYLSDDQFWFSFFHEAGHLLLHSHQDLFIEGIETPNATPEQEANEFASRILIPPQYQSDLLCLRPSTYELVRFARRIGVSPGIVVGQLQHYGKIRHNHFNGLKRRYKWE